MTAEHIMARPPCSAVTEHARHIVATLGSRGVNPRQLCNDSRRLQRGDIFVAYPGARSDGRHHAVDALERGAALVLAEMDGIGSELATDPRVIPVLGLRAVLGALAAEVNGHPSRRLHLVGVTGTNGKTSSTQWVANALVAAGRRCALIGTLGNGFPGELDESANTTPDALLLHAELARFVAGGAVACAMEVSSIGLEQGRCSGVDFDTAVFTNLTRDHLDYHGTMEAYADAKRSLFVWPGLRSSVVNLDDPFGRELLAVTTATQKISYALGKPVGRVGDIHLQAGRIDHTAAGIRFDYTVNGRPAVVEAAVVGDYNVANLLAVAGSLIAAGIDEATVPRLLSAVQPAPGRMQRFGGASEPLVAVDYAHTPDALANALAALRPAANQRSGKLVCVFGCGGDRDRGKRPLMGEVATKLADQVWITSDNPRSEDPAAIIRDVLAGTGPQASVETDRRMAIAHAIGGAAETDVILVAGKGHENYQEIHGRKLPYSDSMTVVAELAAWREARGNCHDEDEAEEAGRRG